MGIVVEFNPDIALRNHSEFENGNRLEEECLPTSIEAGKEYPFLKEGQRNYWFDGELALLETQGNAVLSRPLASIRVIEATHFQKDGVTWTKGIFRIEEVFNDGQIHFDWMVKVDK